MSGSFVARAEHHEVLASTNDLARQRAGEEEMRLPLLILADRQTAGRGRGTHRWWTGPGSLALSLLLDAGTGATGGPSPLLGLAAAVAVVETVKPRLPDRPVGLHWPNDVYVGQRKLAGVLVEVLGDGHRIVGIGLNSNNRLADAPPELHDSATTLLELTGQPSDPTEVLVELLAHLDAAIREAETVPEQLAARADGQCLQHGRTLTIRLGEAMVTGRCRGLASDGALRLETAGEVQAFRSGVLVNRPTS